MAGEPMQDQRFFRRYRRLAGMTGGRYVLWSWNPGGRSMVDYDYARCDLFPRPRPALVFDRIVEHGRNRGILVGAVLQDDARLDAVVIGDQDAWPAVPLGQRLGLAGRGPGGRDVAAVGREVGVVVVGPGQRVDRSAGLGAPGRRVLLGKAQLLKDRGLDVSDWEGREGDLAAEGNYVAVRPSGTEPKAKFYMFAYVPPEQLADLDEEIDEEQTRLQEALNFSEVLNGLSDKREEIERATAGDIIAVMEVFTDVTERTEDKWTIAALKDELRRRGT